MESQSIENRPEFAEIRKRFQDSKMTLKNVTKVESDLAVNLFEQEKKIMKEHLDFKLGDDVSSENLHILDLYHGTREKYEEVLNEGLDVRNLKHFGHFGRGIYFSDDPAFARLEAESGDSPKVIYRCKVILGNSKIYPKDEINPYLTREPREMVDGKKVTYDSVEGNVAGFTQYVVYEKRRILMQYALTYETTESLPTLPPLPEDTRKADAGSDNENSGLSDDSSDMSDGNLPPDGDLKTGGEKKKEKRRKESHDPPEIITDTLNHLMSIRGLHPQNVYDELLDLFYRTYIEWPENGMRPLEEVASNERVGEHVKEFCSISKCSNEVEAKIFLALYNCDVNRAALEYITMVK